ncbi:helix-turn-helix domain-containing protein [Holdemania massiliensis]|uniref:helix-turn-helix domain-containing protein n=1 Tax=Holdemania massiliensis TaxID=1468449 RepID=UPI00242AB6C5|nr:helix-turn-helix transcriptional regulator [Holdemania massiliensis]
MEIHERLKHLRKNILKITQDELGEALGLSKSNISNIEIGRISLTDRNIQVICATYNVNEDWLKTGEGNPFNELSEQEELAAWMGSIMKPENDGGTKQRIIRILSRLEDDEWEAIEKIAVRIAEEFKDKGENE